MKSIPQVLENHASRSCAGARRRMSKLILRLAAIVLLAGLPGWASAQGFTENFDNVSLLAGNGWFMQNNSVSGLQPTWFQGTPTNATPTPGPFDAFNGAGNSYIAANFQNTTGTNTISNWLVMPNRTLRNGDVFTFYTRKPIPNPTDYPDRLEVRLSTNGASTNVGAGPSGVGDFTTLLLSINPTLVAGGYPYVWTQYTITMSGLPAPTSGRMAFRYFVTSGGPTGANSDYIGIDNAVYTPYVCPAFTMTPGGALDGGTFGQAYSTTLTQTGALGAPNYGLTAGALPPGLTLSSTGTIAGTPTANGTFNFTATVNDASGCSGSQSYSITVVSALPGAPQNVAATAGDAQIDVTWDAPASDGGDPITGYNATCTDGADASSATGLVPPINVTGLTNGNAYTCTVAAINGVGQGAASAPSNSVTPKGNQTITFSAQAGQTYSPGGTFAINPPASASSGLAITYGSTTTGVCTISGVTVSVVAAGTCTLTADQAGNAAWNPAAQAVQSLNIAQATQTLTFPTQSATSRWFLAGTTFAINPQASSAAPNSGAPIVYTSLSASVCSVSGTTVTMVAIGACQIAANQVGDSNFTAAAQVQTQVMLLTPTEADLWVEKTADNATARIGDTVEYSIIIGNDGIANAINVRAIDLPPTRLDPASVVWSCVAATGTVCPDLDVHTGVLDATIATLPMDAAVRFELSGSVIRAADPNDDYTSFDNTAYVTLPPSSGLTDPSGNNQSTATVLVTDGIFTDGFEPTPP